MTELVLGFIPLLDCASLAVAAECGLARDEGLTLTLVRESSWANIRDRLVVGHFDAAHMLGPMTVASTLGLGHVRVPLVAPIALGLGGNAITVSTGLREEMRAHDAAAAVCGNGAVASSGDVAAAPPSDGAEPGRGEGMDAEAAGRCLVEVVRARARSGRAPLAFGMVYPFSCHNYQLRYWLAASGIDPDHDVRLVVIPPALLNDSMRAGHIDGFCVGEPWSSVAVEDGAGSILLSSSAIWRLSPEKVLGCRADWAARCPDEAAALVRCLYRASAWCSDQANHEDLARLLAEPRYVGERRELLARSLANRLVLRRGDAATPIENFYVPFAEAATFPWVGHALWFYSQMVRWGQTRWSDEEVELVRGTYRPDLYRAALAGLDCAPGDANGVQAPASATASSTADTLRLGGERFFDGRLFDPRDLRTYGAAGEQSAR